MKLINADCIQAMKEMAENSVDSIVTDPPYELGFMGKKWDSSGIAFNVEVWQEALRVLKPGGHLLAFSGSRTYHRMVVAIEDAGFEIRDQIMWIYGSGFPKSHNVANAIDKFHGAANRGKAIASGNKFHPTTGEARASGQLLPKYEARTEAGKDYEGWGTALKPAHEPIVVARKPLIGTVAENVLEHGVGGLNIDGCRIAWVNEKDKLSNINAGGFINGGYVQKANIMDSQSGGIFDVGRKKIDRPVSNQGRWPANIIFDEQAAELLDEQSGNLKSGAMKSGTKAQNLSTDSMGAWIDRTLTTEFQASEGGASRFFFCAKASKRDRNEGLEDFQTKQRDESRKVGNPHGDNPRNLGVNPIQNFHPTVKPTSLMRYLVRLVTPPNGLVLDPFMGSGSTGKACALEHFDFVGIELNAEYIKICEARIENALQEKEHQQELF